MTTPCLRPGAAQRARRCRSAPLLGLLLAVGLVLAGCGSGGGEAAAQDDPAAGDPILDFYQCLRDNGFDVPDPGQGGGITIPGLDQNDAAQMAVVEDCRDASGLSAGGPMGGQVGTRGDGTGEMADAEALIEFTQCMRDNGIDMADPTPDGGIVPPDGFSMNSPSAEWQDGMDTCREHLAGGGVMIIRGDG